MFKDAEELGKQLLEYARDVNHDWNNFKIF